MRLPQVGDKLIAIKPHYPYMQIGDVALVTNVQEHIICLDFREGERYWATQYVKIFFKFLEEKPKRNLPNWF